MNRCGYNHNVIPVCPVCGPTSRYLPRPIRLLALWILIAVPAVANPGPTKSEREAASWTCQMGMIKPDGTMPPAAPCVCRARVGLPEAKACKAMRGAK